MANRGRPSVAEMNPVAKTVFTREFVDADGIVTVWHYDLNKRPQGPYKVTVEHDPTDVPAPPTQKKKRKKRKPMTAAQKKAAAERLEKARAARKLKQK